MVTSHPDEDTEVEEITHVCHFALDMLDALISYNIDHPGRNLNLRIGINVGPLWRALSGRRDSCTSESKPSLPLFKELSIWS